MLDLGQQPNVTEQKFRLDVDGAVENRLASVSTSSWRCRSPRASPTCTASPSGRATTTTGAASPPARCWTSCSRTRTSGHVIFTAYDGYTTNVRLDQFDQPDVFLVHQWEGKPITREHGGPVRMLVPKLYLWKSAKWLRRIHFTISDHPGFWETRGYHNNADPWMEERYG